MAADYEALMKLLLRAKQDPKLSGQLDRLGSLFQSEEGQKLMQMLAKGGLDTLKTAADAAVKGDRNAARGAMTQILSTKEGAAFAMRLADLLGEPGGGKK